MTPPLATEYAKFPRPIAELPAIEAMFTTAAGFFAAKTSLENSRAFMK